MWDLLRKLYDLQHRVWYILNEAYYKIKSIVKNVWTSIANTVTTSIKWANAKIEARINDVKAWVGDEIKLITKKAWRDLTNLKNSIWATYYDLKGKVIEWVADVRVDAKKWFNQAKEDTLKWFGIAQSDLVLTKEGLEAQRLIDQGAVSDALANVQALIDPIVDPSTVALIQEVKTYQFTLTNFLTNPLAFTAAYVRSIFMLMLEFSLAYALGAVETALPPWPVFGDNGAGGPLPYGPGPPPGTGAIAPPVKSYSRLTDFFRSGHPGLDIAAPEGTIIYACHDGKVSACGWSTVGYGNRIIIGGGEWWTLYAHLSQINVKVSQVIKARDPIGKMGCTGNSTCSHLHLEVKQHGRHIDPLTVLAW